MAVLDFITIIIVTAEQNWCQVWAE